ncbi:CotH kinase family protein [Porticoccaceae bacterium]|nr:CotH kinase family protein [Porticoccaceae bacterium]
MTFDPFGDSGALKQGDEFSIPGGSVDWAGFYAHVGNQEPIDTLTLSSGGTISFTATLKNPGSANLRFKFERLPWPDTDPSFYTSWVTIDSTNEKTYVVDIPAQSPTNTYKSFLLYINEVNTTVILKDFFVDAETSSNCSSSLVNGVIKIEAECYENTLGDVDLENTQDVGGGQNVGWIDAFDSMIYSVDIPATGNYRLNYRLASPNGSAGFNVLVDGAIVDNFSVNATGGWQSWQTQVGRVIALSAGQHDIQLDANGNGMNLNWFSLTQTNDSVDSTPVDNNDSSNGQPVDSSKWFHQTQLPNGYSWYNNEVQHYTDELENSFVSNGTLKIVAKKQTYTDQGHTKEYTSARLNSKFAFKYGRVEFRAKMPTGHGTWPAVWMLGKNITEPGAYFETLGYGTTGWPATGEIDILEHWGSNQGYAQSAMHTPSSYGGTINHDGRYIPTISSQFHVYAMDWNASRIVFTIDGIEHYRYNPLTKDDETWPFNKEMFLLLNIAIEPTISASFSESSMEVDYLRVYNTNNDLIFFDEFGAGDSDNDGVNDELDDFPNDPNEQFDTDGDGTGNNADTDDDNDGVADNSDAFPEDSSESVDTDGDGIGNNADPDDDNDGVADNTDAFPQDNSETLDTDADGIGNNADPDDDNDGVADNADAFPQDNSETLDTDADGIGNNADTDDDGDGVADNADAFPQDSSETLDTDADGVGNNTDPDDDGDGILDVNDSNPLVPDVDSKNQIVLVSNSPNAVVGGLVSLDFSYDVSTGDNSLTGLGVRIHYDSSVLEFNTLSNVLQTDLFVNENTSEPDVADFDGNPITDQFVLLAWASLYGNWPGVTLPANLFTANFSVNADIDVEAIQQTQIGFSSNSNASGYNFVADNYSLQIVSSTWDFDNNGQADALTDGLLMLRHSFGLKGESLTNGAIASDSTMSGLEVEAAVAEAYSIADIDNNGKVDALTDGLMLLRYLFNLRDESLVQGAVASDAQRTQSADIEQYLNNYLPTVENTVADNTPPEITLNGDSSMGVAFGEPYIEPGAVVTDNQGGELQIDITGTVGEEIGTYQLTYSATDSAGNTSSISRNIVVDVAPEIDSFSFLAAYNPALSNDLVLDVNGNTISGRIADNISIKNLVASFEHDGEIVSVSGLEQTNGTTLNDFTQIKEYKVLKASGVSKTYSVDITKFTSLPIVNITTNDGVPISSKEDYVMGSVTVDGGRFFADLDSTVMEIRGRGNSTWGIHPKKPYQMKLDTKENFLDMPKDKKWIFLAEYSDKTLLRNTVAFELGYLSALDWTPKSEFAEVFINGEYNGTYNIAQKVEEKTNRVNIGNEGFLLEKDIQRHGRVAPDDVYFNTGIHQGENVIVIKEPNIERIDENDYGYLNDTNYIYISNYINQFENTLLSDAFADPINGYASYIDVESFIDWFLINEIAKNVDAKNFASIYFTHVKGEKIKMGPIWDFDLGFGNTDYFSPFPEDWHVRNNPWISRLLDDPAFVTLVQERFTNHYLPNKQHILDKIDTTAARLNLAQQENFGKWQILGVAVWPNFFVFDTYQEEVDHLKQWFIDRMNWIEQNIQAI